MNFRWRANDRNLRDGHRYPGECTQPGKKAWIELKIKEVVNLHRILFCVLCVEFLEKQLKGKPNNLL